MKASLLKRVRGNVLSYHKKEGRNNLPWRKTRDPYKILVSEVMLQQTQVDRVIPYYTVFIKRFPSLKVLAEAPLKEVLLAWSGLGYNRRAKFLHEAAKVVVAKHDGKVPKDLSALKALPGVGDYTAKAVRVFAYGEPDVLLETNIRTVILHHFFTGKNGVSDVGVCKIAHEIAQGQDSRLWHAALMDYGSFLKRAVKNPSRRSKHYVKQGSFKGSVRQVRGVVLKQLGIQSMTLSQLEKGMAREMRKHCMGAVEKLLKEGLLRKRGGKLSL